MAMKVKAFLLSIMMAGVCSAQTLTLIQKTELLDLFKSGNQTVVINFWATWCKPCMEEMPMFVEAATANDSAAFVFVSFDFTSDTNRVKRAIKASSIPGKHYLLNETDMDAIINAVDSAWSGALPATWRVAANGRQAHLKEFESAVELKQFIESGVLLRNEEE